MVRISSISYLKPKDITFDALSQKKVRKIICGKKHFEALGNEVAFEEIDSFEEFIEEQVVI